MKFCVIGLGRFGYKVATVLAEHGMEVVAVDSNESIVASIRDLVTQAICVRIADETSLRSIGVEDMDAVIVGTGENFAQSILITALLKQRLKVPTVIARGINEIHKEILTLIGANQIILPEQEIGMRLADDLATELTSIMRLTKNFAVAHIQAPKKFIGKTLEELKLLKNYNIQCIGIKKADEIVAADDSYVLLADDKLVCAGAVDRIKELMLV
jgi:trk system potassium uptake protein TrkA